MSPDFLWPVYLQQNVGSWAAVSKVCWGPAGAYIETHFLIPARSGRVRGNRAEYHYPVI